ncbi:MAG TPA: hypothetical protein VFI60_08590 [Candidatus Acidoferrum sp.]|nr:hypothetical protein [Candidatus Acidoferrum sp.]
MKRLIASAFFFLGSVSLLQAQTKPLVLPLDTDNAAQDFSSASAAKITLPEFPVLASSFSQPTAGSSLNLLPPALNTALSARPSAGDPTPAPDPRFVYGGREDYRWQLNLSLAWFRFQSTPFNSNAVGVKSTVTYFLNEWLGVEGSFTGAFAGSPSGFRNDAKLALYGGGPKIAWRQKRWEPWLHGIFGGAHALPQTAAGGQNSYSIMVGGGADYRANPRISYRLEADYVRAGFYSQSQNNLLLAGGIVFHF